MRLLKQELRNQLRLLRRNLSTQEQENAARSICSRLLQSAHFKHAQKIALYLPFDGEVSTHLILQQALSKHKSCYAPVLANKQLSFAKITLQTPFKTNRFGILEPDYPYMSLIPPHSLDMVLMPLVGFDKDCHRLGMGGGYYDRTFAFVRRAHKPLLIGLAYDFQKVSHVPRDRLDLSLKEIITEKHHYYRQGA